MLFCSTASPSARPSYLDGLGSFLTLAKVAYGILHYLFEVRRAFRFVPMKVVRIRVLGNRYGWYFHVIQLSNELLAGVL